MATRGMPVARSWCRCHCQRRAGRDSDSGTINSSSIGNHAVGIVALPQHLPINRQHLPGDVEPVHFFFKNTNNPDFITGGVSQLINSINANTVRLLKKYDGSAS